MLDSETKLSETTLTHKRVISWSSSGKAFRIYDTTEFANIILPKYFRTKKFSSFQRNLNLVSTVPSCLSVLRLTVAYVVFGVGGPIAEELFSIPHNNRFLSLIVRVHENSSRPRC